MAVRYLVEPERFALRRPFGIAGKTWTHAEVCTVTLEADGVRGRGEGAPIFYAGETIDTMVAQLEVVRPEIEAGADRASLLDLLPAGGARCALECAMWDLEARSAGVAVHELAGLPAPTEVDSAITVTLADPGEMAVRAAAVADHPVLKVKLGGVDDADRVAAVRDAAPGARITVDPNASWSLDRLIEMVPVLVAADVELVEQPLAPGDDAALDTVDLGIPLAADESCRTIDDVPDLVGRYQVGVVKLDKAGGLGPALDLTDALVAAGLAPMVSCMISTSLG
ncbi:MAG: dipeptide epimerase, partial [Actinomycetota bacterium]